MASGMTKSMEQVSAVETTSEAKAAGQTNPTVSDVATDGEQPRRRRVHKPGVKRISVALQGGGSHGAFTWGVMHRLMSEPRLYIDGISGTSAGAMNAVVFADGFLKGKRQGAIGGAPVPQGSAGSSTGGTNSPTGQLPGGSLQQERQGVIGGHPVPQGGSGQSSDKQGDQ